MTTTSPLFVHLFSNTSNVIISVCNNTKCNQQIEGYIIRSLREAFLPMSNISVMSYTSFANSDAKFLGEMFLNSDQTSALMLFTVTSSNRTFVRATTRNLLFFLRAELPTFDTRNGLFALNVTGYEALLADTLSSVKNVCVFHRPSHMLSFFFTRLCPNTQQDFFWILCILVPGATVFLAVALWALVPAVLVGLLLLGNSCITIAAVDFTVAHISNTHVVVPLVVEVVCTVLTVLYAFLYLDAFNDYLRKGVVARRAALRALRVSWAPAGQSALCFVAGAAAAAALTQGVFRTCALFVLLACALALLSALGVVPAVVVLCSGFFAVPGLAPCVGHCRLRAEVAAEAEVQQIRASFFVYLFSLLTDAPWKVLAVILAVVAASAVAVARVVVLRETYALTDHVADNSRSYRTLARVCASGFPRSVIAPVYVLHTVPGAAASVLADEHCFLVDSQFVQRAMERLAFLQTRSFLALSYVRERHVTWRQARDYFGPAAPPGDPAASYRALARGLTSPNSSSAVTVVLPDDDPGLVAPEMHALLRKYAAETLARTGHRFAALGTAFAQYRFVEHNFFALAGAVGLAVLLALALLGLAARAPLAPVVHVLCTVVVCSTALGISVACFSTTPTAALVLAFPLCVAFAMSFQAFCYARTTRYRLNGFNPASSVLRAVYSSLKFALVSNILVAAAFALLTASSVPAVKHVGFLLVLVAAVDLVFVRIVLQPALLLLWGKMNWWPRVPFVIYKKATVEDHGSRIFRYLDNGAAAQEEDEQDRALYERSLEQYIINQRTETAEQDPPRYPVAISPSATTKGQRVLAAHVQQQTLEGDDFDPISGSVSPQSPHSFDCND